MRLKQELLFRVWRWGGGWSLSHALFAHSGVFWGKRLQRVMKKRQLPLEMSPGGRIRTATQHCRPGASGGRPVRAWKPSLLLAGSANQELEGSLSPPALTGDVRSRDGHEPWDFTCQTCRGSWCPRGQVPESLLLEGRKAASLSLSSLYLGIHRRNCSRYLNCRGGCDRQDVTDGVSGVGGIPAVASG